MTSQGSAFWMITTLITITLSGCAQSTPDPIGSSAIDEADALGLSFDKSGPFSRVRIAGPYEPMADEIVTLESDQDGEQLRVGYVRPDVPPGVKVPVILIATPYYNDLAEDDPQTGEPRQLRSFTGGETRSAFLIDNFVSHGYAIALHNVRGTGGSGGCHVAFGAEETAGVDQVITWLATQEWSNGGVGMYGLSYVAGVNWKAAGQGNPHLKAIVQISGGPDLYHAMVRNGTVNPLFVAGIPGGLVAVQMVYGYTPPTQFGPERACNEAVESTEAVATALATGAREPAEFWDARDSRLSFPEAGPPVLLSQGWNDGTFHSSTLFPWVRDLQSKTDVKVVAGPWLHLLHPDMDGPSNNPLNTGNMAWEEDPNAARRWDWAEVVLTWLDRHLKGDETVDTGPAVEVADNRAVWRTETEWPPLDAEWVDWGPGIDGTLDPGPTSATGDAMVWGSPTWMAPTLDRQEAEEACPGCLFFVSDPLQETLHYAGSPKLPLSITPMGPGGIVTAYLYVDPGDQEPRRLDRDWQKVGWAQMDLRYAAGGDEPSAVTAGEAVMAMMEFQPNDVRLQPGDRLVLAIGQGAAATADTFLFVGSHYPVQPSLPVTVHLGEDSKLRLPVIARAADEMVSPLAAGA